MLLCVNDVIWKINISVLPKIRQIAKFKSSPKFSALRYWWSKYGVNTTRKILRAEGVEEKRAHLVTPGLMWTYTLMGSVSIQLLMIIETTV